MDRNCQECKGEGWIPGEEAGNFHDCPDCDPANPNRDCATCHGKGYIAPSVRCDCNPEPWWIDVPSQKYSRSEPAGDCEDFGDGDCEDWEGTCE